MSLLLTSLLGEASLMTIPNLKGQGYVILLCVQGEKTTHPFAY